MHPPGEDLMPLWQRGEFFCFVATIIGIIITGVISVLVPGFEESLSRVDLLNLLTIILIACPFIGLGIWFVWGRIYWRYYKVLEDTQKPGVFKGVIIPIVCFVAYVLFIVFICLLFWHLGGFGFLFKRVEV